jgi:hypothetical protein
VSAYIVDRKHIVYLVSAMLDHQIANSYFSWYWKGAPTRDERSKRLGAGDYERAAEIANQLWQENIKSVSYRYPGESSATLPGPVSENFVIDASDFRVWHPPIDPVQLLKSINCYAYQTCEHPEWEESEAHAMMESLKQDAIRALPGYEHATWGAPEGFTQRRAA